jgi:hypothetical protein
MRRKGNASKSKFVRPEALRTHGALLKENLRQEEAVEEVKALEPTVQVRS